MDEKLAFKCALLNGNVRKGHSSNLRCLAGSVRTFKNMDRKTPQLPLPKMKHVSPIGMDTQQ
uniref:Uncharacterized protein n=1 Tax=Arion vulgaris TaxID=1028688 RepID=A0A0B6Z1Y7_9EUPU